MNIYIGNLATDVTEDDLKELFSTSGDIKSVKIIKDFETNQSRGFAFVEMFTAAEGQKAISSLNGTNLKGKDIKVNEARPKNKW
jgi:RNA recognition motif-containing protein